MIRTKSFQFLRYFLVFFLLFSSIALFISLSFTNEVWYVVLFQREFTSLPLIFYLVLFSAGIAYGLMVYLKLFERRKLKKVEEGLRMMSQGHYSASIFLDMYSLDTPLQVNKAIDQEFIHLHEKLMMMAEEAVDANKRSNDMSKETKEEILENERHRLARELHDSVSQQLFAAAMMLSALTQQKDRLPEEHAKQLSMVEQIIGESQTEMRALLLHLRPVQLDGKTLKQGVEQLLKELRSKINTTIKFEIEEVSMNQGIEDHLFRIAQELLSNVLRHAKAQELEVYLKKTNETVQLRVVDDGKGFDMTQKKSGSYGLKNIQERISGIGGYVKIISFPEKGTSVEIRIPIVTGGEQ